MESGKDPNATFCHLNLKSRRSVGNRKESHVFFIIWFYVSPVDDYVWIMAIVYALGQNILTPIGVDLINFY